MFEIYCRILEINSSINLFRAFYKLNKHGHWFSFERCSGKGGHGKIFNEFCTSLKHWKDCFFLIDCRAIPDAMPWRHQDSSVADPPPTGVRVEDIRRLCEHVIDLRLVYPTMLYTVGLTTIWKHMGHHPVFKDGEGNVATSMSEFLKFPMAGGVRVGKGTALADNENERVLAAKRKTQAAKDRAVGKRSAAEGTARHTKKKKTDPLSFALDESEGDDSTRTESVRYEEEDVHRNLDNLEDGTEADSPPTTHHSGSQHSDRSEADTHVHSTKLRRDEEDEQGCKHASGSSGHMVSSSCSLARRAFPHRHSGGDGAGSSLRGEVAQPSLFVPAWKLTPHSILNDAESCRDMMIHLFELGRGALAQIDLLQRYEALSNDYGDMYDTHRSCEKVSDRLTETQNQLVDVVRSRNQLADDHKNLQHECDNRVLSRCSHVVIMEMSDISHVMLCQILEN
ncbi:hypothetical protein Tco_1517770 [Tanacetum coccineum]